MSEVKSPPFAWQDKRVLKEIRKGVEEYGSALAVYTALTVAASDKQAAEFTTTHNWIASASGVGVRTVKRRLADLQRVKVVEVITPTLRAPCTYRLLSADGKTLRTLGHRDPTLGNGGPALGQGTGRSVAQIRRKEESKILGTAERIGMEGKQRLLEQQISKLNDSLFYEHDRTPEAIAQRDALQVELEQTKARLIGGVA